MCVVREVNTDTSCHNMPMVSEAGDDEDQDPGDLHLSSKMVMFASSFFFLFLFLNDNPLHAQRCLNGARARRSFVTRHQLQ